MSRFTQKCFSGVRSERSRYLRLCPQTFLIWFVYLFESSDGSVLQCCPFSAVFLYLLVQAEMLHAQSSRQWMHHSSTAHVRKAAQHSTASTVVQASCSPLCTTQFFSLCVLSSNGTVVSEELGPLTYRDKDGFYWMAKTQFTFSPKESSDPKCLG